MTDILEDAAKAALTATAPELALPLRTLAWAKAHTVPILVIAALTIAAIVAFEVAHLTGAKRATAIAKVTSASDSAMNSSASDAVSAVEAQDTADQTTTRNVSHAQAAVTSAPDAAAADAAGRSGLCAISPDLCPASAVQQPHPR